MHHIEDIKSKNARLIKTIDIKFKNRININFLFSYFVIKIEK